MTSIFFPLMYNKTIIRFSLCDTQNNQGLGMGYQPNNPYLNLEYDITKASSNNCLYFLKIYLEKIAKPHA